jgi:hypothetical protein
LTPDFLTRINRLREKAANGGLPLRRTDGALYEVLGDCLCLCEEVDRDALHEALRAQLRASGAQGNRRYVETTADTPILVARYVLEGQDGRNSFYRYAATLREAARRQIRGADLPEWLRKNGGVNALFRTRPVQARTAATKTLHLNEAITVPKDEAFTITLRRDGRGFFDVVKA